MRFTYQHGERPLDGYTVLRGVGRGGFGEVYYARSDGGKEVALKLILDGKDVEMRGARQCQNIKSPHLVNVYDIICQGEAAFIVMEYMKGQTLRAALEAEPRGLGPAAAVALTRQIASGLQCLHDHGVVHRDLKPENIFLEDGCVKIGDYGLSKFISASRQAGQTQEVGTAHYMAPEIGRGSYNHSVDIYALGALFFEMLTGRPPFTGDRYEVWAKHLTAPPPLPEVEERFRRVIGKALEKDPSRRHASARAFADDLDAAFDGKASPSRISAAPRISSKRRFRAPAARPGAPEPLSAGQWASIAALAGGFLVAVFYTLTPVRQESSEVRLPRTRAPSVASAESLPAPQPVAIGGTDSTCGWLEEGLASLARGEPRRAAASLQRARGSIDLIETGVGRALVDEVLAQLGDDRVKTYRGDDHERVLLPVLLALIDLIGDGGQAIAHCTRALETQAAIVGQSPPVPLGRAYKSAYPKLGIAAYLRGAAREARSRAYREAVLDDYRLVKDWEPQFAPIDADLARLQKGDRLPDGHGVLQVFALVGKGPRKVEVEETRTAAAVEICSQLARVLSGVGAEFAPTVDLSPVRIHRIERCPDNLIVDVGVRVDGLEAGSTETVTDVTSTAVKEYDITRDWVVARVLLRRLAKKIITTGAKGAARSIAAEAGAPGWASVLIEGGGTVANTLWTAAEQADTRAWTSLPDKIQALRLEVPAGQHEVRLTPRLSSRPGGAGRTTRIEVRPGQTTFLLAFLPDHGKGPPPLTNLPVRP